MWAIPMVALLFSCALVQSPSGPPVPMPVLRAAPVETACLQGAEATTCITLRRDDWREILRVLKTYFLALGGTLAESPSGP